MQSGYSRKKNYKLPTLIKQSHQFQQHERMEKKLLNEVQKIDSILKSDNLKSMHRFIFTNQVKKRLSQDLLACIHKQHRLISYGFDILSKNSSKDEEFLSDKIISNHISFNAKLRNLGIRNVYEFESRKNQQLSELCNKKWQVKPLRKRLFNGIQRDQPAKFSYENISKSNATTPRQRGKLNVSKIKRNKLETQIPQSPDKDQIKLNEIQRVLQRQRDNLIGIWLPPKSYPQFYGIIVPSLIKTASLTLKCRLKKYILFKQALNSRLCQAILDYLSEKYQVQLENFEFIAKKQDFYAYFQKIGCKIKSWEGTDKVSICYYRKVEFQ